MGIRESFRTRISRAMGKRHGGIISFNVIVDIYNIVVLDCLR